MLEVVRSNRLEPLVDALAERLAEAPLTDPMQAEIVAVPSRGSERWLSQRLSGRLGDTGLGDGVAAGLTFPFPGGLVDDLVARLTGSVGGAADPWRAERLAWPVLALLDELAAGGGAAEGRAEPWLPLVRYLRGPDGPVATRRLPLARRIADVLDRYALARPAMVEAWEDGRDVGPDGADLPVEQRWQPALWRHLCATVGVDSPNRRRATALAALDEPQAPVAAALPARLSVFGVTALPPVHLEVLAALGRHTAVGLYLLAPTVVPAAGDLETAGNPLRRSLGAVAAGMAGALEAVEARVVDRVVGREALGGSLLARLQADVAEDVDPAHDPAAHHDPPREDAGPAGTVPGPDGATVAGEAAPPTPPSVQVHRCHGAARQVDVLVEAITDLLAREEDLEPRDVLVLCPDLDTFAPLLTGALAEDRARGRHGAGGAEAGPPALPFRLADRRVDAHNAVAAVLLALLDLVDGRAAATEVLDLLAEAPVRARFGLTDGDLARLATWLAETGVRWGLDAGHREEVGAPRQGAHTWRAGLDRLHLGVAMADEDDRLVGDVVPYDDLEGGDVDALGRVQRALDALFAHLRALAAPRPVARWAADLTAALTDLTATDAEEAWQTTAVAEVLDGLAEGAAAGPAAAVALTLPEVRGELRAKLGRQPAAARYASGAITICELAPLRAVPHAVVCVLGLDDERFPRNPTPLGFDLLAADPRPTDRDPRAEDRGLLLDAVLAARRHLLVTYSGHDPRTGGELPPSAPLAELLEALARTRGREATELVTAHPLQPYDEAYYAAQTGQPPAAGGGPRPPARSYHRGRLAAAEARRAAAAHRDAAPAPGGPLAEALPPPATGELDLASLDLADLARFLRNPLAALLRERLDVATQREVAEPSERDPLALDGLARYLLVEERLERSARGADLAAWRHAALRRGALPPGAPGRHALADVEERAGAVEEALARLADGEPHLAARVEVALALDDAVAAVQAAGAGWPHGAPPTVRLGGALPRLVAGQVVRARAGGLDARAWLAVWLDLLAAAAGGHDVRTGVAVGVAGSGEQAVTHRLALPREDPQGFARARLGELVAVRLAGLAEALPLLPRTACALVEALDGGAPRWKAARGAWEGGPHAGGEGDDDAVVLLYGPERDIAELIGIRERRLAELVWRPILAARQRGRA
ncbi:MAG: exodeoxyribonuclease V subunit gamma [Egibacteraceae bacterium]